MPKPPDGFTAEEWEPPEADLWAWGRRIHAADHPEMINQEIAAGAVMPETVETLDRLSPGYMDHVRQEVVSSLAESGGKIPYPLRMGLAIALGLDDPELRPEAIRMSQERLQTARKEATEMATPGNVAQPTSPAQSQGQGRYAPSRVPEMSHKQIQMQQTRAQALDER
jgi:hypothetical protein